MIICLASLLALRGGDVPSRDSVAGGGISRRGGSLGSGGVIGGVARGGNGGVGGGEEFKVDLWVEREMLLHAETVYQDNMRRRSEFFGGRSQPLDLEMRQELESVLVAVYPCPMEERLGIWADGGKVCMGRLCMGSSERYVREGMHAWREGAGECDGGGGGIPLPCPMEERLGIWTDGGR
ncbi:unnamed protein product [Closterium sp. NIES-64]|nr:unnamed protein product [Closterium sp. NIES-64]